jgi:hypothetical protein
MAAVIYRCPTTGLNVQAWFADSPSDNDGETFEVLTCTACKQSHLVNPKTGKVLGGGRKE